MKDFLAKLIDGGSLTQTEAEHAMDAIMQGTASQAQIAGFLTALRVKGETVDELTGFVRSMRKHAVPMLTGLEQVLDTCGTGGSGIAKFNISTASAFITAAAGVPIAKHGNRAVSGRSGSADVLQALGVNIDVSPEAAKQCLQEIGICFMFAPLYHQSMKHAAGPRKELGFKTVFNVLGPLSNPAGAKRQVVGAFSQHLLNKMAQVLQALGTEHAMLVHGSDGLDEITVTGKTFVAEVKDGKLKEYEIHPEEFGLRVYAPHEIIGGGPETNAAVIRRIFDGETGAARDIVVFNAAAGLYAAGKAPDLQTGVELAQYLIDSGKAKNKLDLLVYTSRAYHKELA